MMSFVLYPLACLGALVAFFPHLFVDEAMLGIDLGTTFSVACVCVGGNVSVVPVEERLLTPSVVAFLESGKTIVGREASHLRLVRPGDTIYDSKRLIGRKFDDGVVSVEAAHLPYALVNDTETGRVAVKPTTRDAPVLPDEVARLILRTLKLASEAAQGFFKRNLGFKFGTATVTVPVSFTKAQRRATERAGVAAGFKMVRLLDEPVAAALAYKLDRKGSSHVLVYDFGGGTLDVALLRVTPETRGFLVWATAGDEHLGGEDFDRNLVDELVRRVRTGVDRLGGDEAGQSEGGHAGGRTGGHEDMGGDSKAEGSDSEGARNEGGGMAGEKSHTRSVDVESGLLQQLWRQAEKAKRTLQEFDPDTGHRVHESAAFNAADSSGERHNFVVTASEFDALNDDLYARALEPIYAVLKEADIAPSKVDDVVLVGGSSRLWMIRKKIRDLFAQSSDHTRIHYEIDPDLAIAYGAARSYGCR